MTAEEENCYLVNRHNKILMKKGSAESAGANCPSGIIFTTAPPGMEFPNMGHDADRSTFITGHDNYLLYEMERQVYKQKH